MANNAPNEKESGITRSDLIAIIEAVRKPVKTDKEIREEAETEANREAMQQTLQAKFANDEQRKKDCSHMRSNGSTTAVYITDLNQLYCQVCTKWIEPHREPEIFNKLYQLAI